ncbi:MAG: hypothetical protein IJZ71_00030 [Treponema sp.]|nr:hypothetical protein [Spirochaetaceae bacterium]MBQ8775859.1 hypothetical protein [Treponema sp.]
MKKNFLIILNFLVLFFIPLQKADAYMVKYKEDWYKLFHVHYQQYPDDCMENIYWLEKAVEADFCNPLYADAKITTEKEWEKYRYLFQMHINLKLIEQHLRLGRIYDKKCIYFYDAPWKEEYLSNMEKALSCYKTGLYYWKEAKIWYEKANAPTFRFLYIEDLQFWEDERERIFTGELNYEKIINREITRLEKNISELKAMDENY